MIKRCARIQKPQMRFAQKACYTSSQGGTIKHSTKNHTTTAPLFPVIHPLPSELLPKGISFARGSESFLSQKSYSLSILRAELANAQYIQCSPAHKKTNSSTSNSTRVTKNSPNCNTVKYTFIPSTSNSPATFISKKIPSSSASESQAAKNTWCIGIAPMHLRSLDTISKVFGKRRETVKSWYEEGAPIAYDGTSYCSEYNLLFAWYLNQHQYRDE